MNNWKGNFIICDACCKFNSWGCSFRFTYRSINNVTWQYGFCNLDCERRHFYNNNDYRQVVRDNIEQCYLEIIYGYEEVALGEAEYYHFTTDRLEQLEKDIDEMQIEQYGSLIKREKYVDYYK